MAKKIRRKRIGDNVRISEDIEVGIIRGKEYITSEMVGYKGTITKIIEIRENSCYALEVDSGVFNWPEETLIIL